MVVLMRGVGVKKEAAIGSFSWKSREGMDIVSQSELGQNGGRQVRWHFVSTVKAKEPMIIGPGASFSLFLFQWKNNNDQITVKKIMVP